MTLTDLTVKLLLLFLPGIVCFMTVDTLTVHRERKGHEIFLLTFLYGLLSYLTYALLRSVYVLLAWVAVAALHCLPFAGVRGLSTPSLRLSIFRSLCDSSKAVDLVEVLIATLVAVLLGLAISFARDRCWLHNLASRFHISRKFGQLNVWSFVINSPDVQWATVRDLDNNLMFQGYILAFSDVEDRLNYF